LIFGLEFIVVSVDIWGLKFPSILGILGPLTLLLSTRSVIWSELEQNPIYRGFGLILVQISSVKPLDSINHKDFDPRFSFSQGFVKS